MNVVPDMKAQLLKTIQLPKNVRALRERLPKAKYDQSEARKTEEKEIVRLPS